jgi:circadian clock protein KaiC
MLEGKGFYRGSSILISGTAGSGKTSLSASFADAACRRGERGLYIDFEESKDQVARNMKSIGIDLEQWSAKGLLFHEAWRPTQSGIEMHLLRIHKLVEKAQPQFVIVDPITSLIASSSDKEVYSMLLRMIDFLKKLGITAIFVSLTAGGENLENTRLGISSLTDTWILLRDVELNGERNRCLYVLKSRGMAHSNQLREFIMNAHGIQLVPAYIGSGGVLTGSSRLAQEARERDQARLQQLDIEQRQRQAEQKRIALQAEIASLQAQFAEVEKESAELAREKLERERAQNLDLRNMAKSRGSDEKSFASARIGGPNS